MRNEHNPFVAERGLYVDTSCADFVSSIRYEHAAHSRTLKLLNFPGRDTIARAKGTAMYSSDSRYRGSTIRKPEEVER